MEIVKVKRAEHIKYSLGYTLKDVDGLCHENEVFFKPDDGITDRLQSADSVYAFSTTAKYDIVLKKDLI